eukprot:5178497-Alexandrium_andersonii.AAC.1
MLSWTRLRSEPRRKAERPPSGPGVRQELEAPDGRAQAWEGAALRPGLCAETRSGGPQGGQQLRDRTL